MARLRPPETLTQQLVEVLRSRIETGRINRGDKLPAEHQLIAEFGVSRTVVREAITNLKGLGMVASRQGVGVFVTRTSSGTPFQIEEASLDVIHEVISVLELRISLETEAAALAAERRTRADLAAMRNALDAMGEAIDTDSDAIQGDLNFHSAIARATGNRHFLDLFTHLGPLLIPRSRLHTFQLVGASRQDFLRRLMTEHEAILTAIDAGDAEGARKAMRHHLGKSRDRLLEQSGSGRRKKLPQMPSSPSRQRDDSVGNFALTAQETIVRKRKST